MHVQSKQCPLLLYSSELKLTLSIYLEDSNKRSVHLVELGCIIWKHKENRDC